MPIKLPRSSIYIPALADRAFHKPELRFLCDESPFNYNYILTSAYFEIDRKIRDFRQHYGYPKNYVLMADSGGFQHASFQLKGLPITVTPMDTLRWLEANADIGMNLDVPPWKDFRSSLKKSVDNFRLFENNRENYNMLLYNVLHGKNITELYDWYNAVKDFNFDGWAFAARPSTNIFLQTFGYLLLQSLDATNVSSNFHMFGVSGIKNMIVLSMLSNHFNSSITFDSTSYSVYARHKRFTVPKNIKYTLDFGRNSKRTLKKIPCNCPVCRNTTIDVLYDQSNPDTPLLLLLHNLYQYIEVNRMINDIVTDDHTFDEYTKSIHEFDTVCIMRSMLKYYDMHGIDKTYDEYKSYMITRKKQYETLPLTLFS